MRLNPKLNSSLPATAMRMPTRTWSMSHGCRKHVTMSSPVLSTSDTSTSDRRGFGRLSLISCTVPSMVHCSPMRAAATVALRDRSM